MYAPYSTYQADDVLLQVFSPSSLVRSGQAVATTQAADDQAAVAAGEEATEAVATMATTTRLHPTLAHPNRHRRTHHLAHPPGGQASSVVPQPAQLLGMRWEAATTAALPQVKQDLRTGLEEAVGKLGLRRGRSGAEGDLRVRLPILHRLVVAGRDMNRRASAEVVGDNGNRLGRRYENAGSNALLGK